MIPSPLPAVQKLFSWSMMQPWVMFGTVFQSPKLFTTLPSGSNSMYGGACRAISPSLSVMLFRLTMKTLSCASTHTPLTCPVTQFSGNGFGQFGSTTNCGPGPCAWARLTTPKMVTRPNKIPISWKSLLSFFILPLALAHPEFSIVRVGGASENSSYDMELDAFSVGSPVASAWRPDFATKESLAPGFSTTYARRHG